MKFLICFRHSESFAKETILIARKMYLFSLRIMWPNCMLSSAIHSAQLLHTTMTSMALVLC